MALGGRKEEKVRPEEAPVAVRRCAAWHGRREGIVVDAGGQHGVRPVMERTRHCFERNEWCESELVTRRGGACV